MFGRLRNYIASWIERRRDETIFEQCYTNMTNEGVMVTEYEDITNEDVVATEIVTDEDNDDSTTIL